MQIAHDEDDFMTLGQFDSSVRDGFIMGVKREKLCIYTLPACVSPMCIPVFCGLSGVYVTTLGSLSEA